MKKNIKSRKIISIILVTLVLFMANVFTANVNAANDVLKTSLVSSSSQVKRGETITVTIKLSTISIESGEKGIGAYTAKLDFDSSRLEYVSAKGTDKWETPLYKDKLIVGNTNDGTVVSSPQSVGSITFKVKDTAEAGSTTIKLTNFYGSTAVTDVLADSSSVNITIKADEEIKNETQGDSSSSDENKTTETNTAGKDDQTKPEENNNNTAAGETQGEQNQVNNQNQNPSSESSSKKEDNQTVSKKYLPYTGKFEEIAIITVIGVMTVWMIVSYVGLVKVSKKKVKDEEDK